jgi:hypothetical protein
MEETDEILPIIDNDPKNSEGTGLASNGLEFRSENDLREQKAKWFNFPQAGITPLGERKSHLFNLSHKPGEDKALQIYDCSRADVYTAENGEQYLILPDEDKWADEPEWVDDGDDAYESNSIYIRKPYIEIAKLILEHARGITTKRDRMTLSGTSGTGKSFFIKFFVWLLLHPPEGVLIPEIIIWKHAQGGVNGGIYCYGSFYSVDDIPRFVMSSKCKDLVKKRDAWVIYDGEPPRDPPNAKVLVASSPGNLFIDNSHIKIHQHAANFNLFLPIWSLEELLEVGRTIHGYSVAQLSVVTTKYTQFGGIARYIFGEGYSVTDKTKKNPISRALSVSALIRAFDDVGSNSLDHGSTSGVLVHLIPDTLAYNSFTYQWGSTYIMMKSFDKLFRVKQKEIDCLIVTGEGLNMGTLYGLLFEPWFHRRVCGQGYSGRIRKLKTGREMKGITTRKRNNLGILVDNLGITKYNIPRLDENKYFYRKHIRPECYNTPTSPNYEGLDSLCPLRGEIFQLTVAQQHPVKTTNLSLLRPFFEDFLQMNRTEKVKFIFVVPPNRFETFTQQSYISPLKSRQPQDANESSTSSQDDKSKVKSKKEKKLEMQRSVDKRREIKKRLTELKKEAKKKEQKELKEKLKRKERKVEGSENGEEEEDDDTIYVNNADESDPAWAELTEEVEQEFDHSWLEQWVLELNVDPLTDAIAARNLTEKRQKLTEVIGVKV